MSARVVHWERALADWYARAQTRPFAWGVWDCALAAASAVQIVTGEDPAADFRGRYATEEEAGDVLAEAGGLAGLMATLAAARGWPEIPARLAQRGDVVLADFPGGPTLGVVAGRVAVFPRQPAGLVPVPVTSARLTRAWAIGRQLGGLC